MAVKINGTPVIDSVSGNIELQNVASITYTDASVQTTASGSGAPNLEELTTGNRIKNIRKTVFKNGLDVTDALNRLHQTVTPPDLNNYLSSTDYTNGSSTVIEFSVSGNLYAVPDKPPAGSGTASVRIIRVDTNELVSVAYDQQAGNSVGFGTSVALSGNILAVGAPFYNSNAGQIQLFNVSTNPATHIRTVNSPLSSAELGRAVSIDGNYAVGGGYAYSSGSGMALIINVGTGATTTLTNPNGNVSSEHFGYSVGIHSGFIVIGADTSNSNSGRAYIYGTNGTRLHTFSASDGGGTPAGSKFGYAVGIHGRYAAVGSYNETSENYYSGSGLVRVYDAYTGELLYKLHNPNNYNTPTYDYFGESVSVWGDYLIANARAEDTAANSSAGAAYIFDTRSGHLVASLEGPSSYDLYSDTVSITDCYALIGRLDGSTAKVNILQHAPVRVIDKLLAIR